VIHISQTNKNMAQPLEFEPVSLSQMDKVEAIRTASKNTLYVHTFVSLFTWQEYEEYEIHISDDAYIVKDGAFGKNAFLFPCGTESGKKKLIDSVLMYDDLIFSSLTDEDKIFLEKEYPDMFVFEECRDEFPYLYDKDAQIELKGKEYKRLRHRINTGRAVAEQWSVIPLCDSNIYRALALNRLWNDTRESNDLADTVAAEKALTNFSKLSMWGLIFQADGKDIAYAAGCFITPEIFDICFCKVLDKQCDCFIKWALYKALPEEIKTVDSEDDLGLAGLRRHKLLRQPKELTRVWKGSLKHE
jgi:hypothetical protein